MTTMEINYDNMVTINTQQDTLLSLRLLDNQYKYASKDRVPPSVVLKDITSPSNIAERRRVRRKKWGLSLHNKTPKLCPRPPHSARLPLTDKDRKAFTKSLRARRGIYKTPRMSSADITPRFPEQPDRLLGQPVNFKSEFELGKNAHIYLSARNNIFKGDRSCILGKSTKKGNVSAYIDRQVKKGTFNKYDIERIAKTESNRIRARKEKYPFLYDEEKPVPARMQTGERALIQRVQKMMVENCRGPAQLHPDKPQRHIPDVRWWRFTKREDVFHRMSLDLAIRKVYCPNYAMTERKVPTVKFSNQKMSGKRTVVTPSELGIQIRKTKMLRQRQKNLELMYRDIGTDSRVEGTRFVEGGPFAKSDTGRIPKKRRGACANSLFNAREFA